MTIEIGFGGINEAAGNYAEKYAAESVVQVSNETMLAIRAAILRSFRDGGAPFDAAKAIRGIVGLTARQAQGALNYRATLVELGHKGALLEKLFDKYVSKKIRQRATTISRTETMKAMNNGAMAEARQAVKDGLLGAGVKKGWSADPAERTCPICSGLDGVEVGIDEDFPGQLDAPPAHPMCRCSPYFLVEESPARA
jgi:hypothetical protein